MITTKNALILLSVLFFLLTMSTVYPEGGHHIKVGGSSSVGAPSVTVTATEVDEDEIDYLGRAQDYAQAFKILKASSPDVNIYLMVGGASIDNVEKFEPMENGTLVIVTIKSGDKLTQKVLRTLDIKDIGAR